MDKTNNNIIAFSEKAESALLDIEKKYNLEEKDEEWMKKLKEKKPFNRDIVRDSIREFINGKTSEKTFADSLQKKLGCNKETAEKIFKDASDNIIPFLIKTSEEEIKKGTFKNAETKPQQPILAKPIRLIKEEKPAPKITKETESPPLPKINPKIDKPDVVRKKIEKPVTERPVKDNTKKQTDTYREPIE